MRLRHIRDISLFERTFNLKFKDFTDVTNGLDVISFDAWMVKNKGYNINKHGSLTQFITKKYSKVITDLIKRLL